MGTSAGRIWLVAAVLLLGAAVVAAIVFAADGEDLIDATDDLVPVLAAAAAVVALAGWALELRPLRRRLSDQERAQADEREAADERVQDAERERDEARSRGDRLSAARASEHRWNRDLRGEISALQRSNGALSDYDDVREVVLKLALTLLEAEQGLLLSRKDEDHDGKLDLVAAQGFKSDPADSAVAQRFAKEVIEQDCTVREDASARLDDARRAAADEEVRNLVAIQIYIRDDFAGVVVAVNNPNGFDGFDDDILLSLGDHAGAVLENTRLHGELRGSYLATVRMLAEAIEAKDPFLGSHSDDVSQYVIGIADRLGMADRRREELVFGSLLHDVGKIGISERILLKPGKLSAEERSVIELHPRIGYRLVEQVPALRSIALAILHHHERYDGDGYPSGLRGEEIPLEARIIAVVDAFSAMVTDRPYRARMSVEDALAELERCAGTQFDPEIVGLFVEEVRAHPLDKPADHPLAAALDDPELAARRTEGEPLLGHGAFGLIDSLTLLYTHRHLHERLRAEVQRARVQGRGFALALIELTELPSVNRERGFAAGDAVLEAAARSVQRAAGRCGGTACRYSGRRLALVAPGIGEDGRTGFEQIVREELGSEQPADLAVAIWSDGLDEQDVVDAALGRLAGRTGLSAAG